MGVLEVVEKLQSAGASMRCAEVKNLLEEIGFEVRDGKKAGHKLVRHPRLSAASGFTSTSYTCGHGKNPEVKRVYITKLRNLIRKYEPELRKINGETND